MRNCPFIYSLGLVKAETVGCSDEDERIDTLDRRPEFGGAEPLLQALLPRKM